MKWIPFICITCFILWACNNATDNKESGPDASPAMPSDTVTHMGDTSSYERMPNSTTDTIRP